MWKNLPFFGNRWTKSEVISGSYLIPTFWGSSNTSASSCVPTRKQQQQDNVSVNRTFVYWQKMHHLNKHYGLFMLQIKEGWSQTPLVKFHWICCVFIKEGMMILNPNPEIVDCFGHFSKRNYQNSLFIFGLRREVNPCFSPGAPNFYKSHITPVTA